MRKKRNPQQLLLQWYEQMALCFDTLNEEERSDLERWDRTVVDGSGRYSTSDWPGWEKHIGKPPRPSQGYFQQRRKA